MFFALIIFIILVAALVAWLSGAATTASGETACTHDCDQGRNCTCEKVWPFPKKRP